MSRKPVPTAEVAASDVESAREWIRRHADLQDEAWETAWRRANAACRLPLDNQGRLLPRPADSRRRERDEARRALVAAVSGLKRYMRSAASEASALAGVDWRERGWERERRDAKLPHQIAYCDVFVALRNADSALQALVEAVGRPQLPGSTGFAPPAEKRRRGERAAVQFEAWQLVGGVRRAWEALEQPRKLGAGTAVVASVALGLEGPIQGDWDQRIERWKKRLKGTKPRAF